MSSKQKVLGVVAILVILIFLGSSNNQNSQKTVIENQTIISSPTPTPEATKSSPNRFQTQIWITLTFCLEEFFI